MKKLGSTDLKRLHRSWNRVTDGRLAVMLDAVQTPFNVGAIVRTAAAFRVERLYLTNGSIPPGHPRSRKVSMGTERYLSWDDYLSVSDAADAVKDDGFTLVGIELTDEAVPIQEAQLPSDVCLALGHEERGLSQECLDSCDLIAFVPQLGKVGSLNIAAAAAIAMYEVRRRAWEEVQK